MNAANILKPALSRGEVQVIGATTFNEYRKYIEKDSALERRFQPVKVGEPTIAQTVDIIAGVKDIMNSITTLLLIMKLYARLLCFQRDTLQTDSYLIKQSTFLTKAVRVPLSVIKIWKNTTNLLTNSKT